MKSVNEKSVTIIIFAFFGFFVYPLAIAVHQHFYGDGAFFFAQLVEHGKIGYAGTNPARYCIHLITQVPTIFALNSGISTPCILSRIYGATLYYFPLTCYLFSAWLLLLKKMPIHLLLLLLMLILLSSFTSLFIISESYPAAALFIVTLSVIVTCDLDRWTTLLALLCLALVGLYSYEFWAAYYLLCLVYFIKKTREKGASFYRRVLQVLIMILFLGGAVANGYAIIIPKYPENRDAMLSSHLHAVWPTVLSVGLFFGAAILNLCFSSIMQSSSCKSSDNMITPMKWYSSRKFDFVTYLFGFITCFIYIINIYKVNYSYNLRLLNLILPIMFGLSFLFPHQRISEPVRQRVLVYFIIPLFVMALSAHLYQTDQWNTFRKSFSNALQVHAGYIPLRYADIANQKYLWSWTSPTMSILLQALESRPVQTILFNPKKRWEPYGPSSIVNCNPEALANRLGVPFCL